MFRYTLKNVSQAAHDVWAERQQQLKQWGACKDYHPFTWLAILTEEVGEVARAALETQFDGKDRVHIREEAIQVAAVAIAMVEALDAEEWSKTELHAWGRA
jgi:NTP pyrophosphatase (non-canonical NTP hydrolase)